MEDKKQETINIFQMFEIYFILFFLNWNYSMSKANITYVCVNNRKFKIYLDRPIDKCLSYSNRQFLISAHLKIQQIEKYPDMSKIPERSKSLVNSIIEEIIHIHQEQSKNTPWFHSYEKEIGITSHRIEFFVESVMML